MDIEIFSGEFAGYYSYNHLNDLDHEMHCSLVFCPDGRIMGHGVDDVNPFHFEGKLDPSDNSVVLTKNYPTHKVEYTGILKNDNNCISISGIWSISGIIPSTGAFTLRKGSSNSSIMADIDKIEKAIKKQLTTVSEL